MASRNDTPELRIKSNIPSINLTHAHKPPRVNPIEKVLPLRFSGSKVLSWIAKEKDQENRLIIVREIKRLASDDTSIKKFLFSASHEKQCEYAGFMQVKDLMISNLLITLTYEYLPISLAELCGSPALDDQDIPSILKQVIHSKTPQILSLKTNDPKDPSGARAHP